VKRRLRPKAVDRKRPSKLPALTLEDRLQLHFNGDIRRGPNVPSGHADGDVIVRDKTGA